MGLFKSACRPAKTDPAERDLSLPLPSPAPTRKKPFTTYPKTPSHQDFLITNVMNQGQIP